MPLGHKKQRKNETEMEHPQKRHLQKSAAQAERLVQRFVFWVRVQRRVAIRK